MANKIPESVRDQLDSMLHLGAAGDLSDGQLLDRVDASTGGPAEAAFAVLVERHGPMVLRVCRDAIGNPHDAEDACQAVFLVLARKAGSVRGRESAAGWLFGVARKVASRARRDEARRREHERRKAELAARRLLDATRRESWEELYEEIDRLPESYRAAVVLCHLEGLTHEEAASRLRCPLRTLQSRLLRARARLRDRLARRGVAPGAGALALLGPGASLSTLPAKFAGATVRLALSDSAGMVPAAVATLADGVLAMSTLSKLNLALVALMAVGLAAGVVRAVGSGQESRPDAPRPPAVVAPAAPEAKAPGPVEKEARGQVMARGVVVDEAGRPVSGAEILARAFTDRESRGVTGPDGSFAVPIRGRSIAGTSLLARSPDGDRLGTANYEYGLTPARADAPVRITLKPGRRVSVRVADASKAPIEGSTVDVIGRFRVLAEGATGLDGVVGLLIPADAKVESISALKSGRGLDYAEFGRIDDQGRNRGGAAASEIPAAVALVLEGPRTAKIRAVDDEGKPLAGIGFGPWYIPKEGRRGELNLGDYRSMTATTDLDGVATFDWLPPIKGPLQFWPRSEAYAHRRVILKEGATETVTTRMTRAELIRGHVFRPDGSPAPGIQIAALGTGIGNSSPDHGGGRVRTAADGSYEIVASPGEGYAVAVEDDDWAAPSRLDVAVRRGQPAVGVDFKLTRGTIIRGTVTVGPDGRIGPRTWILFNQTGEQGPVERWENGEMHSIEIHRQFMAETDAEGRYSTRVGPGTYRVTGPMRTGTETVVVKDEPELVRDYRMPRPEKGPISGRVVEGATGKGVAGAKVEIVAVNNHGSSIAVTADADGRFRADRELDPLVIHARNPDGSLAAIVDVGAEDPDIVIPISPTATVTGLLIDEQGKPAPDQKLSWGRRVYFDEEHKSMRDCFATDVSTDAAGKFTLPALVVGQTYVVSVYREEKGYYLEAGIARPESPGPVDLGRFRVSWHRHDAPARSMSSFREGGPEPGDPAPPIEATTLDGRPLRLEDFRGKFVLLDFWATWCGPCLGEIPQLQAVHDAFGADERFAILSLSVDEKADEPRQFQEKRKLPWAQGFLGQGIHSTIPDSFGVRAIPAFVLVGPDGKIVAKGMRGDDIKKEVARAIGKKP